MLNGSGKGRELKGCAELVWLTDPTSVERALNEKASRFGRLSRVNSGVVGSVVVADGDDPVGG